MDFPKRGGIWFVSLEPVIGHEIGKTRPALVISNDRNNLFADTVIRQKWEKSIPLKFFFPAKRLICLKILK